jgi:hypothetical protein
MSILLRALARGGSTPIRSNTISSSFNCKISISQFSMNYFNETLSNSLVVAEKDAGCSNVDAYIKQYCLTFSCLNDSFLRTLIGYCNKYTTLIHLELSSKMHIHMPFLTLSFHLHYQYHEFLL